jgi:hypothetical protein
MKFKTDATEPKRENDLIDKVEPKIVECKILKPAPLKPTLEETEMAEPNLM